MSEQPGQVEGVRMNEQKPVDLEAIKTSFIIEADGMIDARVLALCNEIEALRERVKELDVVVKNVEEWEADESRGAGEAFDLLMQFMQIMRPDEEPSKGSEQV